MPLPSVVASPGGMAVALIACSAARASSAAEEHSESWGLRPCPPAGEGFRPEIESTGQMSSGKSKRGLSKGGLGPKGANWAKKGPFGAISALPSWLWGAEELVPRSAPKRPRSALKRPQFAPKRPDFPGRICPRFALKIWGLSPHL